MHQDADCPNHVFLYDNGVHGGEPAKDGGVHVERGEGIAQVQEFACRPICPVKDIHAVRVNRCIYRAYIIGSIPSQVLLGRMEIAGKTNDQQCAQERDPLCLPEAAADAGGQLPQFPPGPEQQDDIGQEDEPNPEGGKFMERTLEQDHRQRHNLEYAKIYEKTC